MYLCGLHDSAQSLEGGNFFENIASFAAIMGCFSLGLRSARRRLHLVGESFSFFTGSRLALGCAAAGGLFTALGQWSYVELINPEYKEHWRLMLISTLDLPPEVAAQSATAKVHAIGRGAITMLFGTFIGAAFALLFRDRPAPQA